MTSYLCGMVIPISSKSLVEIFGFPKNNNSKIYITNKWPMKDEALRYSGDVGILSQTPLSYNVSISLTLPYLDFTDWLIAVCC